MEPFKNNKIAFITLFLSPLCFAYSAQDKIQIRILSPTVLELRKQAVDCEKETGVPASHLKKIIDHTLPDDKPNKEFFKCVTTGTGFVDKDGHAILERVKVFQVVNQPQEDFLKYLEVCNKIVKEDSTETLAAVANCVYAKYEVTAESPI